MHMIFHAIVSPGVYGVHVLYQLILHLFCISYLNIFEEEDLETERQFFKEHPELGQFDNTVIIGTVFPPPQEDTGLIKVRVG